MGRYELADSLLMEGLDQRISATHTLYVYAMLAGGPFEEGAARAEGLLRGAFGDIYTGVQPDWRWLMGGWLARTGDLDRLELLVNDMARTADEADDRQSRLYARALDAHLALARADTSKALSLLRGLSPTGPRDKIAFEAPESLAAERLLLAEVLMAQGDPTGAIRIAALLDHTAPVTYLLYLPRSLAVRIGAAEGIGSTDLAEEFRTRLDALGWNRPSQEQISPH
ncbi:MAG: hypothetical protein ABIF09_11965, partial [Gemmatimonadota bacterium]